jgi:HD-GYP domain-containing protein (c-di-GMP phosphodiesterase class II)
VTRTAGPPGDASPPLEASHEFCAVSVPVRRRKRGRNRTEGRESRPGMLAALCAAIESRDPYTRGHSARTSELAVALAERLDWTPPRVGALRLGGLLHDVGKLVVAEQVLRKAGPLKPIELDTIRRHPVAGAQLLQAIPAARPGLACVLFHHERWDGAGYPTGRAGEDIPIDARVLAVADAFDAMTTPRPYRRALSVSDALMEIIRCAGTQFDPELALTFVLMWEEAAASARAAS